MNKLSKLHRTLQALLIAGISIFALAPANAADAPMVTANNYVRAESDIQMTGYIESFNCFGRFEHVRKPYDVDNQITVRGNRDTLYSWGVFDLRSPLTVTLPETAGRYQSLMIVSQDHSIWGLYGPKTGTLSEEKVGTRYVCLVIRTFADPNDEKDMKAAHQIQDAVSVKQADIGKLEVPDWNKEEVEQDAGATINVVAATITDAGKIFGKKEELDPVYWMLGAALGWGGLPAEDCQLCECVPRKERREDRLHPHREGRAGGRFLVRDPLRRGRAGCRSTNTRPTRSTMSPPRRTKTAASPFTSAATPRRTISCPSSRDGITSCGCIGRGREILDGTWRFPAPKVAE